MSPASYSTRPGVFLLIACLLIVVAGLYESWPVRRIVIETGPAGGGFFDTALRYQAILKAHGYEALLKPKANSLTIIDDVASPESGVDVGFAAQDLRDATNTGVVSLGRTELQPLFMLYRAELGPVADLGALRGRRIVMPPQGSATSKAALAVMKLFGLTAENTTVTFLPLDQAVAALETGSSDLGMFMLPPANEFITRLGRNPQIRLLDNDRSAAIGRLLPFLVPIVLPKGVYDVAADIPPAPMTMLAAPVEVLVRKDIQPGVAYALLEAMTQTHRGATLVSDGGQFPAPNTDGLEMLPAAAQYYRNGTPWMYKILPRQLAGFVDNNLALVLTLLVVSQVTGSWKTIKDLAYLFLGQISLGLLMWLHRSSRREQSLPEWRAAMVATIERTLRQTTPKERRETLIREIQAIRTRSAIEAQESRAS